MPTMFVLRVNLGLFGREIPVSARAESILFEGMLALKLESNDSS